MTDTVIPFPEREHTFAAPCADPAYCSAVFELTAPGTRTIVCVRCGKSTVLDATLDELDAAIAAAEAVPMDRITGTVIYLDEVAR